jgi:hypothetical protein
MSNPQTSPQPMQARGPVADHRPLICKHFRRLPDGAGSCIHPDQALLYPAIACNGCRIPSNPGNRIPQPKAETNYLANPTRLYGHDK